MNLIRDTWRELWRRNRGGGLLTLAFWYTMLISLYQYLVASRLGPSLPKSLRDILEHPNALVSFPHLSGSLWFKIILVYLTFLFIVVPYAVGGLYGGIARAMGRSPEGMMTGFLSFFRYGYVNFWRALSQILLAVLYGGVVIAILTGFYVAASLVTGVLSIVTTSLFALILFALVLWTMATLLYWFGYTFSTDESPVRGFLPAVTWGLTHLGKLYARILVLAVVVMATLVITTLMSSLIPLIGPIILVLVLGMVFPAFMGTYAMLLFQEASGSYL